MSKENRPERMYAIFDSDKPKAPSYERVIQTLTDAEIISEIEAGRGDPGYQDALREEASTRQIGGTEWRRQHKHRN